MGKIEPTKMTWLSMCGFIAQLVEHHTGICRGHGFKSCWWVHSEDCENACLVGLWLVKWYLSLGKELFLLAINIFNKISKIISNTVICM